jgi:hypothetical protein
LEIPKIVIQEKKVLLKSLDELMYGCICQHLNTGHKLCEGECHYDGCECQKFTPISFQIECPITAGDLFESEVPNHSEKDSTSYWNEFFLWKLRRK